MLWRYRGRLTFFKLSYVRFGSNKKPIRLSFFVLAKTDQAKKMKALLILHFDCILFNQSMNEWRRASGIFQNPQRPVYVLKFRSCKLIVCGSGMFFLQNFVFQISRRVWVIITQCLEMSQIARQALQKCRSCPLKSESIYVLCSHCIQNLEINNYAYILWL